MKNLYFTFLTVCVNAMISIIPSNPRTAQSSSDDTFEKKIEEGYEMLKNESSINETIAVVMELHNMEEKIVKQLISSPEANALFLDEIRNHTKFIGRNRTEPVDGRTIEEVNEKNKVNMVLFEGDVILTKEQAHRVMDDLKHDKAKRTKRQAHRSATRLWPSGIVYYSFDSSATDTTKRLFKKASDAWSRDTCVEFKEDDKASDRVVVHETLGCVSHIGKVGGKQKIYLGQLCESIGYVAHEIGHTLGLFHTQSRPDRDEYVRVVVENIRKDFVSQFRVQSEDVVNNYDLPYEYGSIMHYSARRCKALLKVKPCTPTYNGNVRRKLCPKSCEFCL
uniref:Metalloendopeptidase n=1 Tax=Angiostrongylus cantonensis TaxID=6313 RepID=A0A0K0DK57_ANGCA